ncbi:MAG: glycosyltransferase [Deltaproteobacteria bacterium]|jgi:glycosyltransferase involved in cell wall biosynthesis|nr:glycosyltransferase [Deltaproteobacteria bacterium]
MKSPKVSILLPVRNEEVMLPAALRSLQRQTLEQWELVVINDGSTDGTAEIIENAAARDSRIRPLHLPAMGLVRALNTGLPLCRSELVARMDGDDICHPRRLQLQVEYMTAYPATSLVACRVRHIPRSSIRDGFLAYEDWQNSLLDHASILRDFFVESPFAHPSVMFRNQAVQSVGGYRDMGWAEDYDLWLRLMLNGARFARLPQTLLFWRDHPHRLSRTGTHCTLEAFRSCKAYYLTKHFLADQKQVTLWGAGLEGKEWRRELMNQGVAISRWIDVDPRKIGQVIHGAPVHGIGHLSPGQEKILITIGARGARDQVRNYASTIGLVEGVDFVCVT